MLLLIKFFLFSIPWYPHGDLDIRINEVNQQIEAKPDSIALYLKRGELYLQHEDLELAKADFTFCLQHQLDNSRVLACMADVMLQTGSADSALLFIDKAIIQQPDHLPMLELKSTILSRLGKYCKAAATLDYIISLSAQPSPVVYISSAQYWSSCPDNQRAIAVIKEGLQTWKNNTVLQQYLINHYIKAGMNDEALDQYTSIIETSGFKARPYMQRAALCIKMGSPENARKDLQTAMSYVNDLPARKKDLPAIRSLNEEIVIMLAQLND